MSFSVHEYITRTEERLAEARAVAEAYPDAKADSLPGGAMVRVAESVKPTHIDVIDPAALAKLLRLAS